MSTEALQSWYYIPTQTENRFLFKIGLTLFVCGIILALAAHSVLPQGLNVANGTQGVIYALGYQMIIYGIFMLAYAYLKPVPLLLVAETYAASSILLSREST